MKQNIKVEIDKNQIVMTTPVIIKGERLTGTKIIVNDKNMASLKESVEEHFRCCNSGGLYKFNGGRRCDSPDGEGVVYGEITDIKCDSDALEVTIIFKDTHPNFNIIKEAFLNNKLFVNAKFTHNENGIGFIHFYMSPLGASQQALENIDYNMIDVSVN